jgi:DNA-binding CsgD family transcriptional regulator
MNERVDHILKTLLSDFGSTHGLSEREAETVALALAGMRTKEIASALGCAPQTIATYWDRIYRKTNTNSREMVLALMIRFIVVTTVTKASGF